MKLFTAIISILALLLPAVSSGQFNAPPTTEPTSPLGELTLHFTDRCKLSTYSSLTRRLAPQKGNKLSADYDLSAFSFVVYVPPAEKSESAPPADPPTKPYGLVFCTRDDACTSTPASIHDELDREHLIFVACSTGHLNEVSALGLPIDAVYNLEKSYPIDPNRVYLLGLSGWSNYVGLAASDIFMGSAYMWCEGFYDRVPLTATTWMEPNIAPVSREMIGIAKRRPQILGFEPHNKGELKEQLARGYTQAGYQHVFKEFTDIDQFDYSRMKPEWFAHTMSELESAKAKDGRSLVSGKLAATKPSH